MIYSSIQSDGTLQVIRRGILWQIESGSHWSPSSEVIVFIPVDCAMGRRVMERGLDELLDSEHELIEGCIHAKEEDDERRD